SKAMLACATSLKTTRRNQFAFKGAFWNCLRKERYAISSFIAFRQPQAINDPLSELALGLRMLAGCRIAALLAFVLALVQTPLIKLLLLAPSAPTEVRV